MSQPDKLRNSHASRPLTTKAMFSELHLTASRVGKLSTEGLDCSGAFPVCTRLAFVVRAICEVAPALEPGRLGKDRLAACARRLFALRCRQHSGITST